jgi:carbon-monoxide dehydrogenase medium subunit
MKPSPFEYHRPDSLEEALGLLGERPDAEPLAGNQSLSIIMSNRLANPDHLVDLNHVEELQYVDTGGDAVEIGAMVRHRDIERSDRLAETMPLFPAAAEQIAGPVVRNRGTIGGSIGEADPAGNYPCAVLALDGNVELASVEGSRTVAAEDYFLAYMFTEREEDELITGVSVPRDPFPPARTGMAFMGVKEAAQTWPTISVAGVVRVDDPAAADPVVEEARLAFANAADVPLRVEAAESEIEGEPLSGPALDRAGEIAHDGVDPQGEMHADERYKRELAGEYTARAFRAAHEEALG